jgi:hypothetical protein
LLCERRMRPLLVLVLLGSVACHGTAISDTHPDGQSARVPVRHRPGGMACPAQRGPGATDGPTCPPDGSTPGGPLVQPRLCAQDSDCVAGSNGRCFSNRAPFATCGTTCSYDACSADSDCPGKAPCECRTSPSESGANVCVSDGNCRIDADCGPAGFCSPSQVGHSCSCPSPALCPTDGSTRCTAGNTPVPCACGNACGHGYYCHTKDDACLDDSDCAANSTCNYDTVEHRWTCATCWPLP